MCIQDDACSGRMHVNYMFLAPIAASYDVRFMHIKYDIWCHLQYCMSLMPHTTAVSCRRWD